MSASELKEKTKSKVAAERSKADSEADSVDNGFRPPRTQPQPSPNAEVQPSPKPEAEQQADHVDDSDLAAYYANFFRVSSTPEEIILDMGLNSQPMNPNNDVKLSQRAILSHYTAKRLLNALTTTLQRHEQAFGVLETDVQRRVRPR